MEDSAKSSSQNARPTIEATDTDAITNDRTPVSPPTSGNAPDHTALLYETTSPRSIDTQEVDDLVVSDEEIDDFGSLSDLDAMRLNQSSATGLSVALHNSMHNSSSSTTTIVDTSIMIGGGHDRYDDNTSTSYDNFVDEYLNGNSSSGTVSRAAGVTNSGTPEHPELDSATASPISPLSPSGRPSRGGNNTPTGQAPIPASLFRYLLRSLGRNGNEEEGGNAVGAVELTSDDEEDEDGDSDSAESSFAEEDMSDESVTESPWEDPVDWNSLPVLPNKFCVADDTKSTPSYLDASLLLNSSSITVKEANEFVWEHGALLQAVLQLLAEREQVGVEGSIESTDNILKKGSLKKLSFAVGRRKRPAVAGAWKVKYVELRQGNLCYYEDNVMTGRKTIHLRQADTVVQESANRGPGFVFELVVLGSPTRYWMASSEEGRQGWMKAIKGALIGDEAPKKNLDLRHYEDSIQVYTALRESLQQADTQAKYLAAIQNVMKAVASLQVPAQWVRDRIENELSPILLGCLKPPKFGRSPQKLLKSSITEFWKNMGMTTFSINGLLVPRNTQLASERILGSLTRCILEFDKAFLASEERETESSEQLPEPHITELQAVSYARNILLTVLRSKERQDSACAVKYLLENSCVVVTSDGTGDDPVHMEVSFPGEDLPDDFLTDDAKDMAAWVWTRTRRKVPSSIPSVSSNKWKQRQTFAVLSGTVLSYYEAASPRPHGLRGQIVLTANCNVVDEGEEVVPEGDSTSNVNNGVRYVLCISSESHQDRLLSFDSQVQAASWQVSIQQAIDSSESSIQNPPRVVTTTSLVATPAKMLKGAERAIKTAADGTISGGIRVIKGAKDGGKRVIKGAKDGGIRVIKTATGSGIKVIRGAVGVFRHSKSGDDEARDIRRPSLRILLNNTEVHGKREPSVQCVVQTQQSFSVQARNVTEHNSDNETDHGPDCRWISVKAKLYQAFLMSGGPSGRIARGDALVEVEFHELSNSDQDDDDEDGSD